MQKYLFHTILAAAFIAIGVCCAVLAGRCNELREKQARQEMILLKQSEILAVNTAMLQAVVSSLPPKLKNSTEKEGLKMDAMP